MTLLTPLVAFRITLVRTCITNVETLKYVNMHHELCDSMSSKVRWKVPYSN